MKKSINIIVVLVLAFGLTDAMCAANFDRYAVIIKRHPFAPPVAPEPNAGKNVVTVSKPPEFVRNLRMCAITESPAGIKVGFVNLRKKPLTNYYLYVGDTSEDGIKLVEADYDKGAALLRQGGEQFWLYMNGSSAGKTGVDGKREPTTSKTATTSKRGNKAISSYAERRRQRLAEMRRKAEEERRRSDAEIAKKLQEYQMERLRRGLTPLPIKLTPEADAELVKEGVLPPME